MPQVAIKADEIAYWKKEFDKCKKLREPFEREWYMNLAFYKGKQYVVWNPSVSASISTQSLVEPAAPRHRVRLIANKVKPAIRTELTKLTKEVPHFYIVPNTPEPSDVAAAKVGEGIAEFVLDACNYNRVRRKSTFWALICGTSFIKTYITPDKPTENGFYNNLVLEPVTAWHIYIPNVQEEDLEKQPYIFHARGVSAEDIKAKYDVDVTADMASSGTPLDQKFLNAIGIKSDSTITKDLCFLKELWIKPCAKYPNGGLLAFVGDTLIYAYKEEAPSQEENPAVESAVDAPYTETAFPFSSGEYPFDKIEHIPSGSFYADSVIQDLIPLQKEYNKTRSQIVESKNRQGKPQRVFVEGSLDPRKVTSEPGLMIAIRPGFEYPKDMVPPPIPGYVIQELDRTLRDMDDLTGQYEVSKGRTPPGVEAASAIAYLQEENDSKLYHTVASIEEVTVSVGKKILYLVNEFWPVEKITHVVSKNASFEASLFKMSDLSNNTDLRVEPGSMAPKSRAAKQAFITDLMKIGIIPPEKGLRYLEMNETNRLYEELQADAKAAQRENYKMTRGLTEGQPLPVNIWDNHIAHEHEHGLYLKSQEFEMLPPEIQQLHADHYIMTKQAIIGDILNGPVGNPQPGSDPSGNPSGNSDPGTGDFPGA